MMSVDPGSMLLVVVSLSVSLSAVYDDVRKQSLSVYMALNPRMGSTKEKEYCFCPVNKRGNGFSGRNKVLWLINTIQENVVKLETRIFGESKPVNKELMLESQLVYLMSCVLSFSCGTRPTCRLLFNFCSANQTEDSCPKSCPQ